MRVLLDHCLPRRFRSALPGHEVSTAAERGWQTLRNGQLLAAAAPHFDVLLTIDKNLKHEQNLGALPLSVLVIMARTNRLEDLISFVAAVLKALETLPAKTLVEVPSP